MLTAKETIRDTDAKSFADVIAEYRSKGYKLLTPRNKLRWRYVPEEIQAIANDQPTPFVALGYEENAIAVCGLENIVHISEVCDRLGWRLDFYHLD